MSQLKYTIVADDSQFKKTMANVKAMAKNSGKSVSDSVKAGVSEEVTARKKAIATIKDQQREVKKLNLEIVRSKGDEIKSGTVVSPKDIERGAQANEAYARSSQRSTSALKAQKQAVSQVKVAQDQQIVSLDILKKKLDAYRISASRATNPAQLRLYNQQIQLLEGQVKRASKAGRTGFDNLGNAIEVNTKKTSRFNSAMNKSWGILRRAAYIIPGLGIGGLVALLIDPITSLISRLGALKKAVKGTFESSEYTSALKNVQSLKASVDLASEGIKSKDSVVKEYNKTIGKTAGELKNFGQVEDFINSKSDAYIKAIKLRANATALLQLSVTELAKAQQVAFSGGTWWQKGIAGIASAAKPGVSYELELQKYVLGDFESHIKIARLAEESWKNMLSESEAFNKANGFNFEDPEKVKKAKKREDKQLNALQDRLSRQSESFQKYEEFKTATTEAEAKKRFAAQIGEFESYSKYLQSELNDLIKEAGTDDYTKFNKSQKTRYDILLEEARKYNAGIVDQQNQSFIEALKLAETYEKKRADIQKKYADAEKALGESISEEKRAVLSRGLQDELSDLDNALVEELKSYKGFFDNIANLSGAKLDGAIEALNSDLDELVKKYPQLKKIADVIRNQIGDAKTAKTAEEFRDIADSLSFMANALRDVEGGFAAMLRTVSDLAGQVSNIKNDIKAFDLATENGSIMGQISSGFGIIGSGLNIVNALNNFFNRTTRADEQRLRNSELQLQATENMTRALERQIKIANEAYGTQKIEEYNKAIKDSNKVIEEGQSALSGRYAYTGDAEIDKVIEKINKGEKLKGSGIFDFFKTSEKEWGKYIKATFGTLATDIESLQALLDTGKLDDQTAKIAQNIINAHDAIKESEMAIIAFNTAVDFDTLSDNLIDAISSGNDAIKELGQNFEDTMKNAILNSLRDGQFKKEMEAWYKAFDAAMDNGLTDDEVDQLRDDYMSIGERQRERLLAYEKATGLDLDDSESETGSGLSGTIGRSITEDTANKWMGVQLNIYTINKNMLAEAQKQTVSINKYTGYAFQNLQTALNIERNTANTVLRLDTAITHLTTIASNTKPGKTARDLV